MLLAFINDRSEHSQRSWSKYVLEVELSQPVNRLEAIGVSGERKIGIGKDPYFRTTVQMVIRSTRMQKK
jgi:hypothetical protein